MDMKEEYNILFVDIRGFTKWSSGIEAHEHLDEFIKKFYETMEIFPVIKTLGDGVMIVEKIELAEKSRQKNITDKLKENLDKIKTINDEFQKLCNNFELNYGYGTKLKLGWGITRGSAKKIGNDYVGENINKCKRLCGDARPFGIIIEKTDFPDLPKKSIFKFVEQNRKFDGIDEDISVWVTEEIATQFIPREKIREKPEVHVAGICIKEDENNNIKILIAKRRSDREYYPDLYEGCGGQLRFSESFIDGIKRHFKLEMNIDVTVLSDIHVLYEIRLPNKPLTPGINFLCKHKGGDAKSLNHSKIEWVSEEQLGLMLPEEFIPGIKEEIKELIQTYKSKNCI